MTINYDKRDFNEIDICIPNGGHKQIGRQDTLYTKNVLAWLTRPLNIIDKCSKMSQYLIGFIEDNILSSVINPSFYQFCRL